MNLDPSTTKYVIRAKISADGIVEKPDVVGAIFGQTEGLLGDELDLRDLQKSSRIGRIEVEIESKKGKSEGEIIVPSSLDQVETVILASSLETIDRVGPCKARIEVLSVEDIRLAKRAKIIERAKQLLTNMFESSKAISSDLTEEVRRSIQVSEIVSYGKEKLPAGPNIDNSDAIIIVEGRSDVLNLLKCGIKNAIGVEGTNIPKTIQELSRAKVTTAFVDGDRGGELILRELLQVAEIDFIARAPRGQEVEELTEKQIIKCLRNKIPAEQFVEMYAVGETGANRVGEEIPEGMTIGIEHAPKYDAERHEPEPKPVPPPQIPAPTMKPEERVYSIERAEKKLSPQQLKYKRILQELTGTFKARLLNTRDEIVSEVPVKELADILRNSREIGAVVFDGIITQRLLDIASQLNIGTLVANRIGNITKQPVSVAIWTRTDLM